MNRKLLALAIGAALALPMAAQAAPTLYGQMNLSVDRVNFEGQGPGGEDWEETQLNSNSSRLGVMGEEALSEGLSAVYKAEWAVAGDVEGANDLVGRDRYVGLKSGLGTIKLGAFDTPLKTSQGMVDVFNDMVYTDMGNFLTGENRLDNFIGYVSPKFADALTVNVAVQSGEDNGAGDDDALSASVVFDSANLYIAAAVDNDVVDGNVVGVVSNLPIPYPGDEALSRDAIRLTGVFHNDALQLGFMLQTSEFANDEAGFDADEEAVLLSAAVKFGKETVKGQYVMSNLDFGGGAELDVSAIELGFDHNFTDMTKVYAQASLSNFDDGVAETENTVLSVGLHTKF